MLFLRDERLDQRAVEARAPRHGHPGDAPVQESALLDRRGLQDTTTYSTMIVLTPLQVGSWVGTRVPPWSVGSL